MFEPTEPLLMFGTQMTVKLRQLTINEINQYSHKQLSDAFIDPKRKKNGKRAGSSVDESTTPPAQTMLTFNTCEGPSINQSVINNLCTGVTADSITVTPELPKIL